MSRQRFERKNLTEPSIMSQCSNAGASDNPFKRLNEADKSRERSHSRTTHLLLALMIIYILAFIPQVILLLMSFGMGICFSETVYDPLGNFMDLLTLLSCGTNFWLYCIMSQQFRVTFLKLFCPKQFSAKPQENQ
ncbi:G-protein coupled receptor activity [Sparganum proliferum]